MASRGCSGIWRVLAVWTMFTCTSLILTAPGVKALRFLKNPPLLSIADVGMNVDFNCTTDDPNATVSLLHSSNSVTWIEKLVTPNKLVLRGQVFTLLNLVLLDGGQYTCKATDQSGQTIQTSATFVHIKPGELPNHFELIPDGPIYVLQGKDGTVTCECDGANIASLKWEFKGTSEDAYAAVPSGWVTNIPEPPTNKRKAILKITKAQLAYSGIYKCTVTVNDKSDFKLVNIQVKAPTAPTIKPYKGETVITEESTKVIQCVGEGYPKPKVTWYRNGKMLNTTNCVNNDPKSCENVIYEVYEEGDDPSGLHTIYTYQTLKIRSAVYPRDIGEFKCVASNGISPDAELSINLDVQVAPKILEQKNLPVAKYDEEFSVSCKLVKGNPMPTFKWQYALQNLDCNVFKSNCFPDVSHWKPVPQQLMITPTATPTNESIVKVESHQQNTFYRCQAFNKLGNDSQLLRLVRLGVKPLRFLKNPPQFATSNVGMNLDFNCTTNDPNATVSLRYSSNFVTWTDKPVTPNKLVLRGQVFTLLNLVLSDGGQYACKATDQSDQAIQSSSAFVFINHAVLPNHFELIPDKAIYVLQGKDGNVTCECEGVQIATLKWEKRMDDGSYVAVPDSWVTNIKDRSTNRMKAILKITNAQLAYSGVYKCTVTVHDKSDFKLTNIHVKDSP